MLKGQDEKEHLIRCTCKKGAMRIIEDRDDQNIRESGFGKDVSEVCERFRTGKGHNGKGKGGKGSTIRKGRWTNEGRGVTLMEGKERGEASRDLREPIHPFLNMSIFGRQGGERGNR